MPTMRIGVDVGGSKIEVVALDERGTELLRRRVATPVDQYDATLEAIAGLIATAERETGLTGTIGIGIPGALTAGGLVKNANSTVLIGRRFADDLTRLLGRELRIANDANCFALSEATDGAATGARVVFGVILGTGVGGGIVIDQRMLIGRNSIAGEWGHNPLPWPNADEVSGALCYCGKRGCIETWLSGPASRAHDLSIAALAGDTEADAALARYEDRLARSLASIINTLDPDIIVLGGGVSNIERLYHHVPPLLSRYVFSDRVDTAIVRAAHGDSSGVRGAAMLW